MKSIVLPLIRLYQNFWPYHPASCRFHPTCSQYTYQAINKYGTIPGVLRGLRRILKCTPWNKGGYDPLR